MLQRWVMGEGDGLHPPADAHEMSEELTRMMLAYLQVRASA